MYLSFRWYGVSDPISLKYIQQIPEMDSVVTSLYDVPAGKLWPIEQLAVLKSEIETAVLTLDVIESLPVHENIKLGRTNRDDLIDIYYDTQEQEEEKERLYQEIINYDCLDMVAEEGSDDSTK